jgi:hydrogenase maturation protease
MSEEINEKAREGTLVLGLGNVLMGDDGFGPTVVALLASQYELPEGVSALDAGTPGFDLSPHVAGLAALIIVDTVKLDAPPGTLRLYRLPEIVAHVPVVRASPHEPALQEALLALQFAGQAPAEVLLVGAVPETIDVGPGLSAPLGAAVPHAIREVLLELERLGHPASKRSAPLPANLWWETRVT